MLAKCTAGALSAGAVPVIYRASNIMAASYATGRDQSLSDKMKESVADAAGTDSSQPSVMEKMREGVGKVTEKVGQMFKEDGKIGHQFTPEGKAGGTAQQVGGPLDKEGAVGKQFTTEGAIGGRVEQAAESAEQTGQEMESKAQQNQGKAQMSREQIRDEAMHKDELRDSPPANASGGMPVDGVVATAVTSDGKLDVQPPGGGASRI